MAPAGAVTPQALSSIALATLLACAMSNAAAQTIREPVMIVPSKHIDTLPLDANATGFFVNDAGDVLTARHVVDTCQSLYPIKAFLSANNVPFTETDTPQLESMQPHAPRAATLEAGVMCGG
jgi:hypothetical protein